MDIISNNREARLVNIEIHNIDVVLQCPHCFELREIEFTIFLFNGGKIRCSCNKSMRLKEMRAKY